MLLVLMLLAILPRPSMAQNPDARIDFRGQVLLPPGTVPPRRWVTVNLLAVGTPYYSRTTAQASGRFRFKNLEPGSYTVVFSIPRVGSISRSVELTRSFADARGRIERQFEFTPELLALLLRPENRATVSVRELQISFGARREFEKAQARLRDKDSAGAMVHLERAVERAPEFLEAINTLGIIAYQAGRYADAERYFRRSLSIDDDAAEPLLNLGGVLVTQGKGREAVEVNRSAVEALPQEALAAAQLGFSYYLLGDYGRAIEWLDRTKELDPAHFTSPQLTLAQIFLRLIQPEDAIEEIDAFLKLRPDSEDAPRAGELRQRAAAALQRQRSMSEPE